MSDELIGVSPDWSKRAYVDEAKYKAMYDASVADPVKFWGEHGKRVDWIKPYSPGAFRGIAPECPAKRLVDGDSNLVITADAGLPGGKAVPLKPNPHAALKKAQSVKKLLVVKPTGGKVG